MPSISFTKCNPLVAISLRTFCPFYKTRRKRNPYPEALRTARPLHVELAKATEPDLGLPERRTAADS